MDRRGLPQLVLQRGGAQAALCGGPGRLSITIIINHYCVIINHYESLLSWFSDVGALKRRFAVGAGRPGADGRRAGRDGGQRAGAAPPPPPFP